MGGLDNGQNTNVIQRASPEESLHEALESRNEVARLRRRVLQVAAKVQQ